MSKQRVFSKALENCEVHYHSDIDYNDSRGRVLDEIDGKLDVRIFKNGQIRFRFWPDGYTTNEEIEDIEFDLKELLNIKPALKLIHGVKNE